MIRLFAALLIAALALAPIWPRRAAAPAPGGQDFFDDFNRGLNTNLNAACNVAACLWVTEPEIQGDWTISSAELRLLSVVGQTAFGPVDTLSQYSAALFTASLGSRNTGPTVRANGNATTPDEADCFYTFRFNNNTDYNLRGCKGGSSCTNIETITPADIGTFVVGDSLGLAIDGQTGDDVQFTVWRFDQQSPPERASWGLGRTICDAGGGCDEVWDAAPSAALGAQSCSVFPDTASHVFVGIYNGNASTVNWDDWRGGDN